MMTIDHPNVLDHPMARFFPLATREFLLFSAFPAVAAALFEPTD